MVPQGDLDRLIRWAKDHDLALFPIRAFNKQPTGVVGSHAVDWSKNPDQWRQWYAETRGCNFGVSCGPSRLIVVDVDRGGEAAFEEWQRANQVGAIRCCALTPTGGSHFYFRVPDGIDSVALRQPNLAGNKLINVRAGRGYVVAPFSYTRLGSEGVKAEGYYQLQNDSPYECPSALLTHCLPETVVEHAPIAVEREISLSANTGWPENFLDWDAAIKRSGPPLKALANAVPGERNELLNKAAFALGKLIADGLVAEWAAIEALQDAGEHCGIPRDEAKARSTIRSGLKAAPKVGHHEPRSAMLDLLSAAVPVGRVVPLPPSKVPRPNGLMPAEPIVERLIYRGVITLLSGASGTGKTSLMASLVAASMSGVDNYNFDDKSGIASDVLMPNAAWIYVCYEGGQHIDRTVEAWRRGNEQQAPHAGRFTRLDMDTGPLVSTTSKREVVINEQQAQQITAALEKARAEYPDLNIGLIIDNATACVENCMDHVQAQRFIACLRVLARQDVGILVLAHPPKAKSSEIYGSHLFYSLGDIVGTLDVVQRNELEWVQWIDFSKHRESPSGLCLELRSKRIADPIVTLPGDWGGGHQGAWNRMNEDLRVPYISRIKVRKRAERDQLEQGVMEIGKKEPIDYSARVDG